MKRIICIGNRYVPQDSAGCEVYKHLQHYSLPPDVEVIDGGLAGLNLLCCVEGAECVIFVDSISGFGQPHDVIVLESAEVVAGGRGTYDHAAGLPYLLQVIPEVCEGTIPPIKVVGLEGPPTQAMIHAAAALAIELTGWSEGEEALS